MTSDPEFVTTLVKMLVFLLLMAGGAAGVLYLLKRTARSTSSVSGRQLINVLSTRSVAPKKSVALIQVPGDVLVVGIAGDSLTLLSKIEDRELVAELSAQPSAPSFSNLLSRLGGKPSKDK
jgi:flagellar biogenesis protein FliO